MASKKKTDIKTVRLKFCGGCRPRFGRVSVAEEITLILQGEMRLVTEAGKVDAVIVMAGCQSQCVDLSAFEGLPVFLIYSPEMAAEVCRQVLESCTMADSFVTQRSTS